MWSIPCWADGISCFCWCRTARSGRRPASAARRPETKLAPRRGGKMCRRAVRREALGQSRVSSAPYLSPPHLTSPTPDAPLRGTLRSLNARFPPLSSLFRSPPFPPSSVAYFTRRWLGTKARVLCYYVEEGGSPEWATRRNAGRLLRVPTPEVRRDARHLIVGASA